MIPFLSVYETNPTETLLELFWETATTGLISDLNADVLTGFDGPSSFGNVDYNHHENQDPNGSGTVAGDPDSKWITDSFVVLDQNGFIIGDTTVTLTSVTSNGIDRTNQFGLEQVQFSPLDHLYRLYIKPEGNFVFNSNAIDVENYTFSFNVIDNDNPSTSTTLKIFGRLKNDEPIITTSVTNYNITQSATDFVTLEANNGSFSNAITGLKWSIVSGDTTIPSFSISPYTGQLSLINPNIPLGLYELVIKVQDAVDTTTGNPTLPINNDYGTKEDTITLLVNVGDEPVPYWLRPQYQSSQWLTPGTNCSPIYIPSALLTPDFTKKYGIIYIGPKKEVNTTPPNYQNSYLPTIPGSNGYYQFAENIEVINAAPTEIIPTGLTNGEYRVSVILEVPRPMLCSEPVGFANIASLFKIYLYKRIYNPTSPGSWQLTTTENNTLTPYQSPQLQNADSSAVANKLIKTSFTIQADENDLYEYAIGIEMNNNLSNTAGNDPKVYVQGEDANYSYDPLDYNTPEINSYIYYSGVEEILGYASGIPRISQDATLGIIYSTTNNIISTGSLNNGDSTIEVTLTTANEQLVSGLVAQIYDSSNVLLAVGDIVGINVDNNPNKIAIQLYSTWSGGTVSLINGYINAATASGYETDGPLYANTIEGSEIKALYTDSGMTQKWIPPVADRFYIIQTSKSYDPGNTGEYTDKPYFCIKVNSEGEIIEQIPYTPDSQTAWAKPSSGTLTNYSYNIFYEEPL